ncbi:MAG: Flap endonuclease 1 [Candidatus Heimdallarchaeota archaeon LC_3]|nr:MAG: Flap endonuclease 1 [Candidatus Heimdallarchaeota archaeon LC_3]
MGIKFGELLNEIREPLKLRELKGKKIGIDAYVVIYQMLARIRSDDDSANALTDAQGRTTSHLQGLLNRTLSLVDEGINLVYCFDGKPPEFKKRELAKRAEKKRRAEEEYKIAMEKEDFDKAKKFAQQMISIDEQIVDDSKKLLDLLGIPYVTAIHDAEAQLAVMAQQGLIDAVASQDYDTFLFGAPLVLRNVTVSRTRMIRGQLKTVIPEKIYLEKALNELRISRTQLINLGLLVGTDFNDKIPKVGIKTGLKLVKQFPEWNDLIDHVSKTFFKEGDTMETYFPAAAPEIIQDYFNNPPSIDDLTINFNQRADIKGITKFLVDERNFSEERVSHRLMGITKKQKQKSLNSFF